jgi:2-phospho-L-lactate guanylyltransferase
VVTVIPFRAGGKTRLPAPVRRALALAMLGDVVEAALVLGQVRVVTGDVDAADAVRALEAHVVADPGGGQAAAVRAGLEGLRETCLVVNADLPCVTSRALMRLASRAPAVVAAHDGTTNALALRDPPRFFDAYGPGSAQRFAAAGFARVAIPELELDVDTAEDIDALALPVGRRTEVVVSRQRLTAHS